MPKAKFTTEFIKRLKPPTDKQKEQYFDTDLTGFMIEVKNTGTKTYYYRYRVNNSQKMIRIGTTTELNFQQAKEKYLELKENQTNPQEPSQELQTSTQTNNITFEQFYNTYYLPYIKTHIKSYETNISIFKNHILPDLKDTPMTSLKKIDVMSYHSNMIHKKKKGVRHHSLQKLNFSFLLLSPFLLPFYPSSKILFFPSNFNLA